MATLFTNEQVNQLLIAQAIEWNLPMPKLLPPSPPQLITSQKKKKKRNQKTRLQYKRRSLQMVQEVDYSVEHSVEHSVDQLEASPSVEASKRVVLKKIVAP